MSKGYRTGTIRTSPRRKRAARSRVSRREIPPDAGAPVGRKGTEMSAAEILDFVVPRSADWQEYAACKGHLKLFFAPKAERPQARARREAKARRLCQICPGQPQCQQYARNNREYGYWGGENEEDRHLAGFTVTAPIGVRARLEKQQHAG